MFNIFNKRKTEIYASYLAEVTFSYMERSEKVFEIFFVNNLQHITPTRKREILCLLFIIYRLGFLLSKFAPNEKQLAVKQLLTMTYLNDQNLDIELDFIADRVKLYDQAIRDYRYGNDRGSPLLGQFVALCNLDELSIIDDFREVAEVISELIRTATLRNNDLSRSHTIVDDF